MRCSCVVPIKLSSQSFGTTTFHRNEIFNFFKLNKRTQQEKFFSLSHEKTKTENEVLFF